MGVRAQLSAAIDGRHGLAAADRLCAGCVALLDIDAAAISVVLGGVNNGTFGSSGSAARRYDELQLLLGEGPCLDSVAQRSPVLVNDLAAAGEQRWPAYTPAMLDLGIRGVFAVPIVVDGEFIGALNVFRTRPGALDVRQLAGVGIAAELAGAPLLDLLGTDFQAGIADPRSPAWAELQSLSRAEFSQATGMLVAQLGVEPDEALIRLRAHAYLTGRSAPDVARDILERRLRLEPDRPSQER